MPPKLRIAVWYNLPSGGAKRALNDQLRGLKARGHEIVAWRPPVAQLDYLPIGDLVEEHEVPLDVREAPSRGQLAYLNYERAKMAATRDAMRRHSEAAAREIAAGGFDLLFASNCMRYHAP